MILVVFVLLSFTFSIQDILRVFGSFWFIFGVLFVFLVVFGI